MKSAQVKIKLAQQKQNCNTKDHFEDTNSNLYRFASYRIHLCLAQDKERTCIFIKIKQEGKEKVWGRPWGPAGSSQTGGKNGSNLPECEEPELHYRAGSSCFDTHLASPVTTSPHLPQSAGTVALWELLSHPSLSSFKLSVSCRRRDPSEFRRRPHAISPDHSIISGIAAHPFAWSLLLLATSLSTK